MGLLENRRLKIRTLCSFSPPIENFGKSKLMTNGREKSKITYWEFTISMNLSITMILACAKHLLVNLEEESYAGIKRIPSLTMPS